MKLRTIAYFCALFLGGSAFLKGAEAQKSALENFSKDNKWAFGNGAEFPGAKGSLSNENGILKLNADFSEGGNYVAASKGLDQKPYIKELSFKIKSPLKKIALRVTDSDRQTHHQTIALRSEDWQNVNIKDFAGASCKDYAHWGGKNDGVFRAPAISISIVAMKAYSPSPVTETLISDIAASVTQGEISMIPAASEELFFKPDTEKTVSFKINFIPSDDDLKYQLKDYNGNVAGNGIASFNESSKCIDVKLKVPAGFYDLVFTDLNRTFGVMAIDKFSGKSDRFFAMDGAFSVFGIRNDEAMLKSYLDILKNAGITQIRDRLNWTPIEKEKGKFDWTSMNHERIRELCKERGIEVLDVCHDAPAWTGSVSGREKDNFFPYPDNLTDSVNSWKEIGKHWDGIWSSVEVWNEPEIAFGAYLPGEFPTALTKTVSYAFKKNGIKTPITSCVFTGSITDKSMVEIYGENGMFDDCDYFSYHNYGQPEKLEFQTAAFRERLKQFGKEAMPFIISECGKPWGVGPARAPMSEDITSAMEIVGKAVEAKASGIFMHFAFVYCYYEENHNNFGMMDKYKSPMRSMGAYVNCVKEIANKDYAGDLKCSDSAIRLARVFSSGDKAVAVIYTGENKPVSINIPLKNDIEAFQIDGTKASITNGQITVNGGVLYIRGSLKEMESSLNRNTKAMELFRTAKSWNPMERKALPLVFQPDRTLANFPYDVKGYFIMEPEKLSFTVYANNLSDKEMSLKAELNPLDGLKILAQPDSELKIQAVSRIALNYQLDISQAFKNSDSVKIKISDKNGNASPIVLTFLKRNVRKANAVQAGQEGKWLDFSGDENWAPWGGNDKTEIKAKFRSFWTKETLRIEVDVEDAIFSQKYPAASSWQGDSVQIAIQPLKDGEVFSRKFVEICAAMTEDGPAVFCHHELVKNKNKKPIGLLSKSALEFSVSKGKMKYIITLNLSELGLPELKEGSRLGFSLLVNNNDGRGRKGYLHWGDGIAKSKNPAEFNELNMK